MKWCIVIVPTVVVALAAGLIATHLFRTGSNVTEMAFAEIRHDMTEADVERILGGPAPYYGYVCFLGSNGCDEGIYGEWQRDRQSINVTFYAGKVASKRMGVTPSQYGRPPSLRGPMWRIRQFLGSSE